MTKDEEFEKARKALRTSVRRFLEPPHKALTTLRPKPSK